MKAEIEIITPCRIVYMRQIGPYGITNSQLMEKFKGWVKCNRLFHPKSIILGIAQDNPAYVKPENCRYDTCLIVPKDFSINTEEVHLGNLHGGKYAVFKINHTPEAVQTAWGEIFLELEKQGFRVDDTRTIIERYKNELVQNHFCEICVPVQ